MARILLTLYLLAGAIEIGAEFMEQMQVIYVVKPMLMILLIAFHYVSVKENMQALHYFMMAGFFFSWIGDVCLMFGDTLFLPGLGGFLIAHVLYIIAFNKTKFMSEAKPLLRSKPFLAFPFALMALAVISFVMPFLKENNSDFIAPVIVYTMVILVMVISAINRFGRVNKHSFVLVFIGAFMFMVSDSLIAMHRFSNFFDGQEYLARLLIMTLYIGGQLLISMGMIEQLNKEKLPQWTV